VFLLVALFFAPAGCRCGARTQEAASDEGPRLPQGAALATSDSATPVEVVPTTIVLTTSAILVNDERVNDLRDGSVDASDKRDGATGFFIDALYYKMTERAHDERTLAKRNPMWRHEQGIDPIPIPWEFQGNLTVIPHPLTSFRTVAEVLYTAGQAEYLSSQFIVAGAGGERRAIRGCSSRIASRTGSRMSETVTCWAQPGIASTIVLEGPSVLESQAIRDLVGSPDADAAVGDGGPAPSREPPLQRFLYLMLFVTDEGFRISASGGVLPAPPGDPQAQDEPSIPLRSGWEGSCTVPNQTERDRFRLGPPACAYDFDAMYRYVQAIKEEYPEERLIIVSAENRIHWQVIVSALDAVRGTEEAPLFPDFIFTTGIS